MERLTKVDGCGENDLIWCFDCTPEKAGANLEHCGYCEEGWRRVLNKLAAYEDTGLTPEEITARMKSWKAAVNLVDLIISAGGEHAAELVIAEREGRLVVLPCKVGDTAYYADEETGRVLMGYVASYSWLDDGALYFEFTNVESDIEWVSVECPIADFGKNAFLAKEEAETVIAAIKRGEK